MCLTAAGVGMAVVNRFMLVWRLVHIVHMAANKEKTQSSGASLLSYEKAGIGRWVEQNILRVGVDAANRGTGYAGIRHCCHRRITV